jgi:hypothetical protein
VEPTASVTPDARDGEATSRRRLSGTATGNNATDGTALT